MAAGEFEQGSPAVFLRSAKSANSAGCAAGLRYFDWLVPQNRSNFLNGERRFKIQIERNGGCLVLRRIADIEFSRPQQFEDRGHHLRFLATDCGEQASIHFNLREISK